VEPDTLINKPLLIHAMERMTLPRYSQVYSLVSDRYRTLLYPLLRPKLFLGALHNLPTLRGGEVHFEEFAQFIIKMKNEYSDRRLLYLVFEELLPPTLETISTNFQGKKRQNMTLGDEVQKLFNIIDVNSDGQLSKTELLTAVTRRRKREPELNQLLESLSKRFPKLQQLGKPGSITNALLEMDTDKDGEVSVEELLRFCHTDIKTELTIAKKYMIRSLQQGKARITEYLGVHGSPKKKRKKKKKNQKKNQRNALNDSHREQAEGFSILLKPSLWRGKLLQMHTERGGTLNFEEFVEFCYDLRKQSKRRRTFRKIFDYIDYDGKGHIPRDEMVEGLGKQEVREIVEEELEREMFEEHKKQRAQRQASPKKKKKQKIHEGKEGKEGKQGREGKEGESEQQQHPGDEDSDEDYDPPPEAPVHHPLRALLNTKMYEVPMSQVEGENKNSETKVDLDFEDFVQALQPVLDTIKERLCVMRTFNVLDVAYIDDDDVRYDKTTFISVTDTRLLGELQRQLKMLDDVPQISTDKTVKIDWSVVYLANNDEQEDKKLENTHRGPGPRPLLSDDLCHIALKHLDVQHKNSRKKERYVTLEELVSFLLDMRQEHRERDAARDLYEAMRFAKGMPSENLLAPAPSPVEYVALLDDAGKEFIVDESHRRVHRRPSRPVDALMVLQHNRSIWLEQRVPGRSREAKEQRDEERKKYKEDRHSNTERKSDDDSQNDKAGSVVVSSDDESENDVDEEENSFRRSLPRSSTEEVAMAHGLSALTGNDKKALFFEHRRIAAADVVARMDHMRVLQRPKLFMEMLENAKPYSFEEFYLFAIEAQRTMKTRAVLRRIFDLIDTDGSNDLSKQELLFAFTRSREVRMTVHQLEGLKTMQDPHLFEEAFDKIDVNNDESASFEELVQFALLSGNTGNTIIREDEGEWEEPEDDEEVLVINGETVDDKWDALRRQEGALPDHDPMYMPEHYSNDDVNETNEFIYEELHDLYEIFDRMWDGVSTDKPKDPYEHIIQILRSEQANRRLRLGIDLTLTDINEPLERPVRRSLYLCCKKDDTESLAKLLEVHQLSLDHRCFYVERGSKGARGDGVKGYAYDLDPHYHKAYDSTLLHAASWFGSDKVLTWLLERGADAFVKDIMGRTARDVAGSDPIRLLLHTRTLGRVWKDSHNPFEIDIRMASFSRWRQRKNRSDAKVWQPASSYRMTALEKKLGSYRVEESDIKTGEQQEDVNSRKREKGEGGTMRGHRHKEAGDQTIIGDIGEHVDPVLRSNGTRMKLESLLPFPQNTNYVPHEAHEKEHNNGRSRRKK